MDSHTFQPDNGKTRQNCWNEASVHFFRIHFVRSILYKNFKNSLKLDTKQRMFLSLYWRVKYIFDILVYVCVIIEIFTRISNESENLQNKHVNDIDWKLYQRMYQRVCVGILVSRFWKSVSHYFICNHLLTTDEDHLPREHCNIAVLEIILMVFMSFSIILVGFFTIVICYVASALFWCYQHVDATTQLQSSRAHCRGNYGRRWNLIVQRLWNVVLIGTITFIVFQTYFAGLSIIKGHMWFSAAFTNFDGLDKCHDNAIFVNIFNGNYNWREAIIYFSYWMI